MSGASAGPVLAWTEESTKEFTERPRIRIRHRPSHAAPEYNMDFELCMTGSAAETIAEGFVKWDGCMNVQTHALHFCEPSEADDFARTLRRVWAIAADAIPRWNGESAESIRAGEDT